MSATHANRTAARPSTETKSGKTRFVKSSTVATLSTCVNDGSICRQIARDPTTRATDDIGGGALVTYCFASGGGDGDGDDAEGVADGAASLLSFLAGMVGFQLCPCLCVCLFVCLFALGIQRLNQQTNKHCRQKERSSFRSFVCTSP